MSAYTEQVLVDKLSRLSNSQQSIQTLSHWIMYHRKRVSTSVEIWERELYSAPTSRKLLFLYLANDIIQTSRKKGPEFVQAFGKVLEKTIVHTYGVVDQQSKGSIGRMLDIWNERKVYDSKMIADIKAALRLDHSQPTNNHHPHAPPHSKQPAAHHLHMHKPEPSPSFALPIMENKYVKAFTEMEQASVGNQLIAEKVSHVRQSLFTGELLPQLKDQEELNDLALELEDALSTLKQYEQSLQADLNRREQFSILLTSLLAQQEQAMKESTDSLHACKQKLQLGEHLKATMQELNQALPPGAKRDPRKAAALQRLTQAGGNGNYGHPPPTTTTTPTTTAPTNPPGIPEPATPPSTPPPPTWAPPSPSDMEGVTTGPPPLKKAKTQPQQPPQQPPPQQQPQQPPQQIPLQQLYGMPPQPYPYGGPPMDPTSAALGGYAAPPPWATPHHPPQYIPHFPPPHAGAPPPHQAYMPSVQQPHQPHTHTQQGPAQPGRGGAAYLT